MGQNMRFNVIFPVFSGKCRVDEALDWETRWGAKSAEDEQAGKGRQWAVQMHAMWANIWTSSAVRSTHS